MEFQIKRIDADDPCTTPSQNEQALNLTTGPSRSSGKSCRNDGECIEIGGEPGKIVGEKANPKTLEGAKKEMKIKLVPNYPNNKHKLLDSSSGPSFKIFDSDDNQETDPVPFNQKSNAGAVNQKPDDDNRESPQLNPVSDPANQGSPSPLKRPENAKDVLENKAESSNADVKQDLLVSSSGSYIERFDSDDNQDPKSVNRVNQEPNSGEVNQQPDVAEKKKQTDMRQLNPDSSESDESNESESSDDIQVPCARNVNHQEPDSTTNEDNINQDSGAGDLDEESDDSDNEESNKESDSGGEEDVNEELNNSGNRDIDKEPGARNASQQLFAESREEPFPAAIHLNQKPDTKDVNQGPSSLKRCLDPKDIQDEGKKSKNYTDDDKQERLNLSNESCIIVIDSDDSQESEPGNMNKRPKMGDDYREPPHIKPATNLVNLGSPSTSKRGHSPEGAKDEVKKMKSESNYTDVTQKVVDSPHGSCIETTYNMDKKAIIEISDDSDQESDPISINREWVVEDLNPILHSANIKQELGAGQSNDVESAQDLGDMYQEPGYRHFYKAPGEGNVNNQSYYYVAENNQETDAKELYEKPHDPDNKEEPDYRLTYRSNNQDIDSTDNESSAESSALSSDDDTAPPRRERCIYGRTCYRGNPLHRQQFAHPLDPDYGEAPLGPCRYGMFCRRRDPHHWATHDHPPGISPPLLECSCLGETVTFTTQAYIQSIFSTSKARIRMEMPTASAALTTVE